MSAYLLMNINDLGVKTVSSVVFDYSVSFMFLFYKILQGDARGNLCPHIFS